MRFIYVIMFFLISIFFIVGCEATLHNAIDHNNFAMVEKCIQKGADINEKKYGWTPLMTAAYHGNLTIAKYLIKEGADLNVKKEKSERDTSTRFNGFTARISQPFLYGNTEKAKDSISSGADHLFKTTMDYCFAFRSLLRKY